MHNLHHSMTGLFCLSRNREINTVLKLSINQHYAPTQHTSRWNKTCQSSSFMPGHNTHQGGTKPVNQAALCPDTTHIKVEQNLSIKQPYAQTQHTSRWNKTCQSSSIMPRHNTHQGGTKPAHQASLYPNITHIKVKQKVSINQHFAPKQHTSKRNKMCQLYLIAIRTLRNTQTGNINVKKIIVEDTSQT